MPLAVSHIDSTPGHETNFGQWAVNKSILVGALINTFAMVRWNVPF
jgi:hypothetical protein